MKHVAVHHIHVKYKGEIYTFQHVGSFVSLKQLKQALDLIQKGV